MVARRAHDCVRRNGIWRVDVDGKGLRRLTPNGGEPSWSPNGREIALVAFNGHHTEVRVLNLATKAERVVSLPRQSVESPDWSPDGSTITYDTYSGPWAVRSTGGRPRPFDLPSEAGGVAWSPDGRKLAFTARIAATNNLDIYRADANGRHIRRLASYPVTSGESDVDWSG